MFFQLPFKQSPLLGGLPAKRQECFQPEVSSLKVIKKCIVFTGKVRVSKSVLFSNPDKVNKA